MAAMLVLPLAGHAQDQSSSNGSQQIPGTPKPAGKSGAIVGVSDNGGQDQEPSNSGAPPIQELGRGGWLVGVSPLHWGALSIGSFDFSGGYNDFRGVTPGEPVGHFYTSQIGTSVIFSPTLSRTNLAFQWRPSVGFVNGQFVNNVTNQDVSFDFTRSLTSRLSLKFQERFSYLPAQYVFSEGFLFAAETRQNQSVRNGFLDGPGTWLTNTASITLEYALSPRTTLTFTPSYNYSHLINTKTAFGAPQAPGAPLVGSSEYSGSASLGYRLSPFKTVGLFYNANVVKFENSPQYVPYSTIGASYSQQLSPTWFITGSAGASTAAFTSGGSNSWTYSLSGDLEKRFHRSSFSLAYTRGLSLTHYASRNFTDRVDVRYETQLGPRIDTGMAFGYQRVNGPPVLSGKYYNGWLNYSFLQSLSLRLTYVHQNQAGDAFQVFTETRDSAYVTLQWDPLHHPRW
jgi:hypothetical protein